MKQQYALGQYFRKRYIEGQPYKLLSEIYDRYQVSVLVQQWFFGPGRQVPKSHSSCCPCCCCCYQFSKGPKIHKAFLICSRAQ